MSSGGMDWAYRMIAEQSPDALGCAILLHLGWRDHPDFRTDRAIARALGKDRASVRRATVKLADAGLIVRRSGQWVAVETVRIVENAPDAPRPSARSCDGGAAAPRGLQAPGGRKPPGEGAAGPLQRGREAPPKRNEKSEKDARAETSRSVARSAPRRDDASRATNAPVSLKAAAALVCDRAAQARSRRPGDAPCELVDAEPPRGVHPARWRIMCEQAQRGDAVTLPNGGGTISAAAFVAKYSNELIRKDVA